jgi:putative RecB family exonuclease
MDLYDLRQKPHLSASGVQDYVDCGLLYKFSRVDKLPPESKSAELVLGSAIHHVLAEFYKNLAQGKKLTAGQLEEIFAAQWRLLAKDNEIIAYKPDKDYEVIRSEGKSLLKIFHQELPSDEFKIIGVEKDFSFLLNSGLQVPIIGAVDLILQDSAGTIILVDHKTTSKSYSEKEVEKSLQMTIYKMGLQANGFHDREVLLRLDCLIRAKKQPKFTQFWTSRTEIDELKAAKLIKSVWEGISKGVFVPNPGHWKCENCGYSQRCHEWFMGNYD